MRIVIDTNAFLVSLLPRHKYWWLFQAILDARFTLIVSNSVLTEYLEKCTEKYGLATSDGQLDFLLDLPNVELHDPHFQWNLITVDPDDNKFVDCAVAANADYIVTNDRHFNVLETVEFPRVQCIRLQDFYEVLFGESMPENH